MPGEVGGQLGVVCFHGDVAQHQEGEEYDPPALVEPRYNALTSDPLSIIIFLSF